MLVVEKHRACVPRQSTIYYRLAGFCIAVKVDSVSALRLWQTWSAKYPLQILSAKSIGATSGILEIYSCQTLPVLPTNLLAEKFEHGTIFTNREMLWLRIANALILASNKQNNTVTVWWCPADVSSDNQFDGLVVAHALAALLRRLQVFDLHAAGVMAPATDKSVLLLGESGSGKSTLTMRLAARGWHFLSDDHLLLRAAVDGVQAWAMRRYFALTDETLRHCTTEIGEVRWKGPEINTCGKTLLRPERLFSQQSKLVFLPEVLIFPQLTDTSHSTLEPLSQSAAMMRLLQQCPWLFFDPDIARSHVQILHRLVEQCASFSLFAGRDVLEDPSRADSLLRTIVRR